MKGYLKFPVYFALGWLAIKCILFFSGMKDTLIIGIMVNVLFLLCAVALGLFFKKKAENYVEVNFLDDMKMAIKSGMVYVGLMFGFIWFFYSTIDPAFINEMKEARLEAMMEEIKSEESLAKHKKENINLRDMSREDIMDVYSENLDRFNSPIFMATIALLSMMMGCFMNSLLVVILFRRVLFRDMRVLPDSEEVIH